MIAYKSDRNYTISFADLTKGGGLNFCPPQIPPRFRLIEKIGFLFHVNPGPFFISV